MPVCEQENMTKAIGAKFLEAASNWPVRVGIGHLQKRKDLEALHYCAGGINGWACACKSSIAVILTST